VPVICFTKNTTTQNAPFGAVGSIFERVEDTFISEALPDGALYDDTRALGASAADNNAALIRAQELHQIPSNAENIQASLFIYTGGGFGSFSVESKQVLKKWFPKGATWNSQTTDILWATPGAVGALDSNAAEDSVIVDNGSVWFEFDVTQSTSAIVSDPITNNGVLLIPPADAASFRFFDGSEAGADGQRPEWHVSYDLPSGVGETVGRGTISSAINDNISSAVKSLVRRFSAGVVGPNTVPTLTERLIFVFGHSLFTHELFNSNAFTNSGIHIGDMSRQSFNSVSCNQVFNQLRDQVLPPTVGAKKEFVSNQVNAWLADPWSAVVWTDILIMASNFEQGTKTGAVFATESDAVLSHIVTNSPSSNIIIYEHWSEGAQYGLPVINGNEMSAPNFETYKALHQSGGAYHNWHIDYQNAIIANGYTCSMIPVGPIIMDALNSETYLAGAGYQDLFLDDAAHGNATVYFLAGAICYIALFGQPNPNYLPTGSALINSAVTNNLSSLFSFIESRLTFYGANGVVLPS